VEAGMSSEFLDELWRSYDVNFPWVERVDGKLRLKPLRSERMNELNIDRATEQLQTLAAELAGASSAPAELLARAWHRQVGADLDRGFELAARFGNERASRYVKAAKAIARHYHGDQVNDVVMPVPGQEPMVHVMALTGKKIVSLGLSIAGAVPLWAHYVKVVRELEAGGIKIVDGAG
jgi:hypothetical protein